MLDHTSSNHERYARAYEFVFFVVIIFEHRVSLSPEIWEKIPNDSNSLSELPMQLMLVIYIYIKSKFDISHFAHNYTETSHVASKPKLLKTLARSGI